MTVINPDKLKQLIAETYIKVTVVTPTGNRPELLKRCIEQFAAQDYPNKEMIIVMDKLEDCPHLKGYGNIVFTKIFQGSIGAKRNEGAAAAKGKIILHMDDDDTYAPDWISKSVDYLINTKADIVGLSNAYFYQPPVLYEYKYGGGQSYVIGASMCYWRRVWEKKQFKNTNSGEDAIFQQGCKVLPHHYKNSFVANIHGANTASHLQLHKMLKITNEVTIKNILGALS